MHFHKVENNLKKLSFIVATQQLESLQSFEDYLLHNLDPFH